MIVCHVEDHQQFYFQCLSKLPVAYAWAHVDIRSIWSLIVNPGSIKLHEQVEI